MKLAVDRAADSTDVAAALAAEGLTPAGESSRSSDNAVLSAYDALVKQTAEYERCAEAAAAREREAADRLDAAAAARAKIDADLGRAVDARAEAEMLRDQVADEAARLSERDRQIRKREQEAEAGFAEQAAKARTALDAELANVRQAAQTTLEAERIQLVELKEAGLAEIEEMRRERLAEVDRQRSELERRSAGLAKHEERLEYDRGALRGQEILLNRRENDLDAEIAARAAAEVANIDRELHVVRIQAEAGQGVIDDLSARLAEHEKMLLKIGSTDPAHLLDELARLRTHNIELRDKLAARLEDDDLDRLRRLEQQNRDLASEREQMAYQLQELRGAALANRINNLQVKQLSDAERHFEVLTRGYEGRIAELRATVEELYRDRPDPGTPLFPRCVAMDNDPELSEPGELATMPIDLSVLARDLQASMFTESQRAYRLNDVSVLLGGLAMSRLHLLEGMSGIGKTSLPKALAAAFGAECAVIEVQAGWRDRTDLFGHHNTFERRFEESEFLQALYRAQTPRHRDRPFFIVLDEMNLSRPEQYFSVVLSKLENDDGEPVQLVTSGSGRTPQLLVDGTRIALPNNVWFIGTANQDESTLEFADKTYNRAYLMELPAKRPRLPRLGVPDLLPYGVDALRRAFDAARNAHRADVKAVSEFLRGLAHDLHEHGRTVMGARVEKQLQAFVPVVAAARVGEPVNENHDYGDGGQDGRALAADHFLAMKVLRSLRGRYDVTPESIEKLRDAIRAGWELHELAGEPVRSVQLLDDEQRHRQG